MRRPTAVLAVLAIAAVALASLTAIASSATSKPATVTTGNSSLGRIIVDGQSHTLYLFQKDKGAKSACSGACAQNWPPVAGPATWGARVTGEIGAIARPDGSLQATYDGHPLYTTTADTGPGQTKGDGVWSHGGEWHKVIITVPGQGD